MALFLNENQKRMTEIFSHSKSVVLTDLIETLHEFSRFFT